jgi:peroxiredoxin
MGVMSGTRATGRTSDSCIGSLRSGNRCFREDSDTFMKSYWDGAIAPLAPGTVAPDFTLPQTPRARLALRGLRGQPVVLAFYPMNWEPVSVEQLALYQDYCGDFDRFEAHLLGLSIDHPHSHAAFAHATQLCFPLLADFLPRGAVARLYGVYREREEVGARALFVLDRRGVIRFSRAYPDPLNPGVDALLTTLEALAAHDEPAAGA